jgi:membrane protease YdiL (CAAX protease family)
MLRRHPVVFFFLFAFLLSWYPWILWHLHVPHASGGINPLGPLLSALLVTALTGGRAGLKKLLGRYLPWRTSWRWYAVAVALPVLLVAVSALLTIAMGAAWPSRAQLATWPRVLPGFVFVFLFVGLGEETGWRGFAIPHLQARYSPAVASAILAPLWALWHLPLFGKEFPPAVIPPFLLSVAACLSCTPPSTPWAPPTSSPCSPAAT